MPKRLFGTPHQFITALFLVVTLILAALVLILKLHPGAASAFTPTGMVLYQGRYEHPGIAVRLYNQPTPLTISDSSGNFNLQQLDNGTYWLAVEAPLYLPGYMEATVVDGQVTVASALVLSGGDLNQDHIIDISDITILGANFETTNFQADINADGKVNLLDLAIIGGNLGKTAPPMPAIESQPDTGSPSQPEVSPPTNNTQVHQVFLPVVFR